MDSAMTHGYAVVLFCLGTITALSLALGVSSIVKRVIKKKGNYPFNSRGAK